MSWHGTRAGPAPAWFGLVDSHVPFSSHRRLCHSLRRRDARECGRYHAGLTQFRGRSGLLRKRARRGRCGGAWTPLSRATAAFVSAPTIDPDPASPGLPLASLGVRRCSGFSWTVMTFSSCRGRLMCDCPAADLSFRRYPRGLQSKCSQTTASTAANDRCLTRQKAWRSSAGKGRRSLTR
jgi:hypothetical protein